MKKERAEYLNNLLLLITSLSKSNFNEQTKKLILESYKDGYRLGKLHLGEKSG